MRPTTTILAALTWLLTLSPVLAAPASASLKATADTATTMNTPTWAVLGNMNGADIEALAFLVLMQAAKSAHEDLEATMAEVKAINKSKARLAAAKSAAGMPIEEALVAIVLATTKDQEDDLKALLEAMQISQGQLLADGLERMTDRYAKIYLATTGDTPPSPIIPEFARFLGQWSDHLHGPSDDVIALGIKKLIGKLSERDRPAALASLSAWIAAETRPFDLARALKAKHASLPFDRRWKRLNTLVNLVKGVAEAQNLLAGNPDGALCSAETNTRIVTIIVPPPEDDPS